jgi:hypothetical protein
MIKRATSKMLTTARAASWQYRQLAGGTKRVGQIVRANASRGTAFAKTFGFGELATVVHF